ncbi:3-hydroxyacyl-CoA dehydrogenase type-2 [Exophiala viscosa]|uniref:3-hydroxyacyl-CoA dehydrogenase type-2 n=1 Tax=Exophiala viscosa TaxID=2486360 RepID=A0AAN6IAD5_9EURO|nr:3-hydroxyacyl-CoA dehydrogenase type-2 [Exophiala viscosa]
MYQYEPSPELLFHLDGKTAIITGSARGIGAATATLFTKYGCNVVITDLPSLQGQAASLIESLEHPQRAIFVPASITAWDDLRGVFKKGIKTFGKIDIVVANAGIMESKAVLEVAVDENDDPVESAEANRVIDVNLKGTMNTLRLSMHYMSRNAPSSDGFRGSIVLIASTSGYFGSTSNAAYIASKHGVVGLLRASQQLATSQQVRINAIAPSFTPTYITSGFGESVQKAGLEANTPEMVGTAVACAALDTDRQGTCCLVAGKFLRELENTQQDLMPDWLGSDLLESMARLGAILKDLGGYPLPPESAKI